MTVFSSSSLIGDQWTSDGSTVITHNPSALNDRVGRYLFADASAVDATVSAAHMAFGQWSVLNSFERGRALSRIARELEHLQEEMALLIAKEQGKPIKESRLEAQRAVDIFDYYASETLRASGQILDSVKPGARIEVTREPLGVFALITPWNFPIVIPAWKTAAALAYGNTVVLKPSEVTPGAACLLAQAIQAAQIPVGAFNLLLGTGANLGSALVTHPKVVGISFTGSVATGGKIALEAISHQKRLQLEMGGKNPLVVLDDAQVDVAVECAIDSAFLYTGQRCTASSRVIVTPGIYEKFLQALIERTEMLRVGDALDPKTQVGPIVNEAQLNKNLFYIDLAAQEGGTIYGGSRGSASGYFLKPCIVTELDNTSRVCREEIFGPVTSVIRAHDYEDALAIANDTAYGLASGICTTSLKHASHFKRHAKSGLVSVNMSTSGVDFHVPFGGRKGSSYGPREQGQSAVEFFTVVKTAYVRGGNGDVD